MNCNNCQFISITEEEQHKQSVSIPHVCTKFDKRVFYGNYHVGVDDYIEPCTQCKDGEIKLCLI